MTHHRPTQRRDAAYERGTNPPLGAQPARKIRSTQAWRKLAKQVIRDEPLCWLQLPGCTRRSETADHIVPGSVRPDLILVRANCRGACKPCNYRRGDTPANQLDELRHRTPKELDERRARRHIASHRKRAPAEAFFDVGNLATRVSDRVSLTDPLPQPPQPPPIPLTQSI
jgi:hypothetical protein